MRWLQVAVAVLSAVGMAGCPSEFGKDGRVNNAVQQDTQEHLHFITECSTERLKEACGPGKENSDECQRCKSGGVR